MEIFLQRDGITKFLQWLDRIFIYRIDLLNFKVVIRLEQNWQSNWSNCLNIVQQFSYNAIELSVRSSHKC